MWSYPALNVGMSRSVDQRLLEKELFGRGQKRQLTDLIQQNDTGRRYVIKFRSKGSQESEAQERIHYGRKVLC
jgi:ribosomal protein S6